MNIKVNKEDILQKDRENLEMASGCYSLKSMLVLMGAGFLAFLNGFESNELAGIKVGWRPNGGESTLAFSLLMDVLYSRI